MSAVDGANPAAALSDAVELARRSWGDVEPNPPVGALVFADGQLVGAGRHEHFGQAHAEVMALREAGPAARGATLVVTLEPCSTHGKTPACTDALLAAGIKQIFVGALDPAPEHAGRGLELLAAAGVDVQVVASEACDALLGPFRASLERSRPHVLAKWAMSADGAIAAAPGAGRSRTVLSGPESQAQVHLWRAHLDAIAVGVGTVVADNPRLTARGTAASSRPLRRVVLDPQLRTPPDAELVLTAREVPTWIATAGEPDAQRRACLERAGVRVLPVPGERPGAWLSQVLAALHGEGVRRLMLEGGATTVSHAFAADVVDQVAVFLTPHRLGPGAVPALRDTDLAPTDIDPQQLAVRLALTHVRVTTLGPDRLLRGDRQVCAATPR